MAGLNGIKEKQEPPKSMEFIKKSSIQMLPDTLKDAIAELEKDTFIKSVLGESLSKRYIELKKNEWQQYTSQITPWEIEQYLDKY